MYILQTEAFGYNVDPGVLNFSVLNLPLSSLTTTFATSMDEYDLKWLANWKKKILFLDFLEIICSKTPISVGN